MKWTASTQLASVVCQFAYSIVIGRLVAPDAFGVFAVANVLLRFVSYLSRLGIGPAVVQAEMMTSALARRANSLSLYMGILLATVAIALTPLYRLVIDTSEVTRVVQLLALDCIIAGAGVVPGALLRRDLRFKYTTLTELFAYIGGYGAVGLSMAAAGAGVYSLIAAALAQSLLRTMMLGAGVRGRVLLPTLNLHGMKKLVGFGSQVSLIGFIEFWASNLDTLAVARALPLATVGQYNRASLLVWLPAQQVGTVISNVMVASFARASRTSLPKAYATGQALMAGALIPIAVFLALSSNTVVLAVLGPQWELASRLGAILAVAAAVNMLSQLPAVLCESQAILRPKLLNQLLTLGVFVLGLIVATTEGNVYLFAIAWLFSEVVRHSGYVLILARHQFCTVRDSLILYGRTILMAMPMAVLCGAFTALVIGADINVYFASVVQALLFLVATAGTLRLRTTWPLTQAITSQNATLGRLLTGRRQ